MKLIWGVLLGILIGTILFCFTMRYMEWAENQQDTMTAYDQFLKHPTAAGKK